MTVSTPNDAAIREEAKPAIDELVKTAWPVTTCQEVLVQYRHHAVTAADIIAQR